MPTGCYETPQSSVLSCTVRHRRWETKGEKMSEEQRPDEESGRRPGRRSALGGWFPAQVHAVNRAEWPKWYPFGWTANWSANCVLSPKNATSPLANYFERARN